MRAPKDFKPRKFTPLDPMDPATIAIVDQRAAEQTERINRMTPEEYARAEAVDISAVHQVTAVILDAGRRFGNSGDPERAKFLTALSSAVQKLVHDHFQSAFPDADHEAHSTALRAFTFAYLGASLGITALDRMVLVAPDKGLGADIRSSAFGSVLQALVAEVSQSLYLMRGGSVDTLDDMRGNPPQGTA